MKTLLRSLPASTNKIAGRLVFFPRGRAVFAQKTTMSFNLIIFCCNKASIFLNHN